MSGIQAPRGTRDILPPNSALFLEIRDTLSSLFNRFSYELIQTPAFENAALFSASIGEESDIVTKEMYVFEDKGGRQLALRPEGTAPVVRAFVEHHLWSAGNLPLKYYYFTSMYRYERPQKGRQREFWQAGAEVLGSEDTLLEVEVVFLAVKALKALGISGTELRVNTMGCQKCRPVYAKELSAFIRSHPDFCPQCLERAEVNPLRIFDCKVEACIKLKAEAPKIKDFLCPECQAKFEQFKGALSAVISDFIEDPLLVRGFDYYTGINFEIRSPSLGAQNALAGGGRYDGLIEKHGGPPTPALGFAFGIDRIMLMKEEQAAAAGPDLFVATVTPDERMDALKIILQARDNGLSADMDWGGRSMKSQLKLANKRKARWVAVLGPDEVKSGLLKIKNMESGIEESMTKEEALIKISRKAVTRE